MERVESPPPLSGSRCSEAARTCNKLQDIETATGRGTLIPNATWLPGEFSRRIRIREGLPRQYPNALDSYGFLEVLIPEVLQ